jgi:hypothetical protein
MMGSSYLTAAVYKQPSLCWLLVCLVTVIAPSTVILLLVFVCSVYTAWQCTQRVQAVLLRR